MIGWILIGIVAFIIVLFVTLIILNRKPDYQVVRMSGSIKENTSLWDKVKDACCTRKR